MNTEVWKNIKGYENYQVSNFGRVKRKSGFDESKHYRKEKILKQNNAKGYFQVALYKNKKRKDFKVHRLVCNAFLINNKNKKQVNHKDGNKLNNNISNLEWCTPSENIKHAYKTKLRKKYYGSGHNNARKIKQYTLNNLFIKEWGSITEAANFYNTSIENIFSCLKGKSKSAKGYKWKYVQMK